jgi:hypothetical protein
LEIIKHVLGRTDINHLLKYCKSNKKLYWDIRIVQIAANSSYKKVLF